MQAEIADLGWHCSRFNSRHEVQIPKVNRASLSGRFALFGSREQQNNIEYSNQLQFGNVWNRKSHWIKMRMVKSYRLQPRRLAEPRRVVLLWEFERQVVLLQLCRCWYSMSPMVKSARANLLELR